jgi:hypothetical protein
VSFSVEPDLLLDVMRAMTRRRCQILPCCLISWGSWPRIPTAGQRSEIVATPCETTAV